MTYITYITYIFRLNHVDNVVFPLILFFIPIHNLQQWQVASNFAEIALKGFCGKTTYITYISYIGLFGAFFCGFGDYRGDVRRDNLGAFLGVRGRRRKSEALLNYIYKIKNK